jgi:hypothetical protein
LSSQAAFVFILIEITDRTSVAEPVQRLREAANHFFQPAHSIGRMPRDLPEQNVSGREERPYAVSVRHRRR